MSDRDPFQYPTDVSADPVEEDFWDCRLPTKRRSSRRFRRTPWRLRTTARSWYIIHTYSGFENKVAESLRTRSEAFGFIDKLGQVLIPTEEVVEMRNGKKVTSKRLLYPGYVLVQMIMDDRCGITSRKRRA